MPSGTLNTTTTTTVVAVRNGVIYVVDIELAKESNMLRLPSDRYSPVRRLSDGLTSVRKYRSQLEKIYKKALQNRVRYNSWLGLLISAACSTAPCRLTLINIHIVLNQAAPGITACSVGS